MSPSRLGPIRGRGGLAAFLRQAEIIDLLESAVAVLDANGAIAYQNPAFEHFNATVRDSPESFGRTGSLLECPAPRAVIEECMRRAEPRLLAQTLYYGRNIPAELTLVIRPILDEDGGTPAGMLVHIAEESVEHADRGLIRRQHDLRELGERVRKLSADKLAADRLARALLRHSPFPMVMFNRRRQVLHMNRAWEELVGNRARDGVGESCERFFDCYKTHGGCPLLRHRREITLEEGTVVASDGRSVPVLRSAVLFTDSDEPVILEAIIDLTERKRTEAEMEKLSRAVAQTADAIIITDPEGVIEYVNPAFEQTTGFSRAEALGRRPNIVKSGRHDPAFYQRLWGTIQRGEVFRDVLINRRKNGEIYYEEKTITPLKDAGGRITHFISTGKDITDRMQSQEQLQYLAYHDPLTALPNRALMMERLEHALARTHWTRRQLAVLFLDLDRFKIINDTLGHDFGDRLLKVLAERLRSCVRDGDTVARLSGDEFAVLLEDIAATEDVMAVTRKILDAFARPFEVSGREVYATASIGVSVYPADGQDATALMRNADTAMYRAKESGKNTYQFYSSDMSVKAAERLALETGLRRALEREEFVLHYQPQVDMRTGRVTGAEALLRWQHPERGLVPPADFIPLLEETGLIVPAGEWVLRTACREIARWRAAGAALERVAVNLSARQFSDPDLAGKIGRILDEHGVKPGTVELEITESVIMQNVQRTTETLSALSAMGLRFAIDDFGTGYSSLAYLKRFAIHTLKIDRSFVKDIPEDPQDCAIVNTIVGMARNLGLEVTAEGVERAEQLAFLRGSGCDHYQGYLFSRPVPAEEFERLFVQGARRGSR